MGKFLSSENGFRPLDIVMQEYVVPWEAWISGWIIKHFRYTGNSHEFARVINEIFILSRDSNYKFSRLLSFFSPGLYLANMFHLLSSWYIKQ